MKRFHALLLCSFCVAVMAMGCDESDEPAAQPAEEAPPSEARPPGDPPEPEVEPSAPAPASASDDTYTLETNAQENYAAGQLAQFGIHLTGKGEWHVNEDFPFAVRLEAPAGAGLAKTQLAKSDAAEFGESGARLDVPFTPSAAGAHRVIAHVEFAMCNPQSCVPKTAAVGVRLDVTPQS